ncbi:MAG: hypothetical protein E7Z96_08965, partial [Actinomycetaceae bacterium]|nr:hypothetical protein [Actinomycetaceae bacterium]
MHTEVPQWLTQAYVRSLQAAGSTLPKEQLVAACASLVERWSSPDRLYHGLTHLVDILSHLEKLLPETHSPELVRLAAWYHGIVFSTAEKETYVRNGGEDEHSSAAVAQKELCELGIDDDSARRVAALIHAMGVREWERTATSTAHTATSTAQFEAIDLDEAALRDVHLTPLAAEPQRYRKYVELIRAEYAHIPDIDFFTARRSIVTRLLQRRRLFVTPLAREWEDSARQNLEAELERLNKRIRQLEAAEEAKGSTDAAPRTRSATTANSAPSPEPAASGPAATRGPAAATPQYARKAEEHSAGFQADTATASHSSPEFAAFGDGAEATGNNANPSEPKGAQNDESDGPGRASGSPKGNGSGVGGTKPSKQALDSLLRASAAEDEAEQAEQARRAQRMGSDSAMFTQASTEDPVSSLESCCDCIEDAKERPTNGNMTAEERKRKRREMISAQLRQRIEERHREAEEAKDARKHAETSAFPAVGTPGGTATEQRSSTGHSPAAAGKESMC